MTDDEAEAVQEDGAEMGEDRVDHDTVVVVGVAVDAGQLGVYMPFLKLDASSCSLSGKLIRHRPGK